MSNSSPDDRPLESTTESTDDADASGASIAALAPSARSIRTIGFWGAIVMPIAYVPLLATGLSTSVDAGLFLGLVALNLAALYAGRAYRR